MWIRAADVKGEVEKRVGARTETWSPFSIRGGQAATECGDEVGGFMWESRAHALSQFLFLYKVEGSDSAGGEQVDLLRECQAWNHCSEERERKLPRDEEKERSMVL